MSTRTQRQVEQQQMQELKIFIDDVQDYLDKDIFEADENDLMYKMIKSVNKLPQWQQNLIYLYAMTGSYSKLAKKLNISIGIVHKHINDIIKKIKESL